MSSIYANTALKFLEWGVSPIPLEKYNPTNPQSTNPKKPMLKGWQKHCQEPISLQEVERLRHTHAGSNIGIALGTKLFDKQLCAVDVDENSVVPFVTAVLGEGSLCGKRGVKGITYFVMSPAGMKSKKLKLHGGERPAVEFLADGTQTVMPPSIHPATGSPYEYVDCAPLFEWKADELPKLDEYQLLLIEAVLSSKYTPTIIAGEGTHEAALKLTAQLVKAGFSRDELLAPLSALFPSGYKGNSLKELPGMIDDALQKGFHENASSPTVDAGAAKAVINAEQPFINTDNGFYKYQQGYWRKVPVMEVEQKVLSHLDDVIIKGVLAPLMKHTMRCIERFAYHSKFGGRSPLICCRNGTVDIRTGELLPHSPDHELLYRLDMDFDKEALCPTYDAHIRQTFMDDEEALNAFNEFAGYSLIPDNSYQKALYLIGEGGSGKSTLLAMVTAIHDPNA